MHKGAGNWVKYSIENDRKRTGKVTTDIKKWREAPHKLDFMGKDTKPVKSGKKVFSVAALKAPGKPAGRKTKELPRVERAAITKKVAKKPKKLHNPYNLPVRRISLNIPESNRENIRSRDRLYNSIKANGIIDEIDNKAFLDRLAPKQLQYIIDNYTEYQKPFPENPRFVYTVEEPRFKLSQIGTPKAQLRKRDSKKPITYKGAAITKTMSKTAPAKKKTKRVSRDKLSVAERAPEVKKPTGTMPAEFDLKSNPERKEFVSDYTGITDRVQRRAKRQENIHREQDKGTYKNADTRRHEASHAKYIKRGEKLRSSVRW
jgi:hypothetical protein